MKKEYLKLFMATCINLIIAVNANAQTTQGSRPNIILIVADDLGYADVGFNRDSSFPVDQGVIPTPKIDELANNGIILKNAHVAHPFCGPSRAALLTGVYPHRIGAQYNLPNDITTPLGIPTNETYFPKLLQDANYNTGAIGKWHLGFTNGSYQPLDRGFDSFFGFLGGGKNYFESIYEDSYYNRLGGSNPVTNEYQDPLQRDRNYVDQNEFEQDEFLTDILTDEAINFLSNNSGQSDPFFLYLSYNAPHTPLQAPASEIAQFKADNPNFEDLIRNSNYITNSTPVSNETDPAKKAEKIEEFVDARITYATMVTNMDTNIGRVINELKKDVNVFNNTLIVFLSDNGGYTYSKGAVNYPLDALKGSVKEGGHKVPMFVHWPNQITSGTTYNHQISALDIYPTLANLANASIPTDKTIDGVDFMDKLIAGENARPDESLLIMRPYNGFHNGGLTYDKWKIVKTGGNGSWKLYDILTDPGETTDLRNSDPNAEQIIQDILDQAVALVSQFKDVKPAWFDNDNGGDGHPHSFLWDDATLPAYDKLFESSALLLESEISKINIVGTTDAVEGEDNGIFNVSLPDGVLADEDILVSYGLSGDATEGSDFTNLSGTVTILNGTNEAEIIIDATADGIDEISETLTVTLQSTTVGTVNTTPASINILDAIAPTNLTAGDVAIVGWKAGIGSAAVAFMLLKDISATTKLSISNLSWKGSQDGWTGDYSIDDVWTWTAGDSFNVGDIFKLDADGTIKKVVDDTEIVVGSTNHDYTGKESESSDGDFDLSTGGDGILIYQVDPFILPTNPNSSEWITGLNTNGGWGTGGGNTFCALPSALANGVNANAVGTDQDNGVYTGALSGSVSQLRASINNDANWATSNSTIYNLWSYTNTSSGASGNIGMSGSLGIEDVLQTELNVFPNPTSNYFNIDFKSPVKKLQIEILSITGKSIKKVEGTQVNKPRIDVSNLPSGLYILKINADNNLSIEKVIKL